MNKKISIIGLLAVIIQLITFELNEITSISGKIENKKSANKIFSKDITYEWEYYEDGDVMTHGIYIPSNADEFQSVPLILYLHGSGGTGPTENSLKNTSLPGVWNSSNWKNSGLENFCAYVLCPNLCTGNGSWTTSTSKNNVKKLLDQVIKKYNIDKDNIIITGESRGGTGALGLANSMSQYFSKCVAFSAFSSGPFNTSMDTLCFYSWYADDASKYAGYWKSAFGDSKVFSLGCGHGSVGRISLLEDSERFANVGTARQ